MPLASTIGRENAKFASEQLFGRSSRAVRSIAAVMRKLHELYPESTAANIAARAKVSTRAVEYWQSKNEHSRRDMSAAALIELILSDDGGALLEAAVLALPVKERPRWWLRQANALRMASIEQRQVEQDEELRQLRLSLLR